MKKINTCESNSERQADPRTLTQETDKDYNSAADEDCENRCPRCGALEEHQKGVNDPIVWMGIGEMENCKCGAEYSHRHSTCKTPLREESVGLLLQMAREVESAYIDLALPMSHEQIALNRSYFGRIINAIAATNHNHIPDRVAASATSRWYEERYRKMLDLMAKVAGGQVACVFMKHSGFRPDLEEIEEMIADYQRDLTVKESVSRQQAI